MGNQCVKDGSDEDTPKSATKRGKYESQPNKIVSLEHVEHPHAKMCDSSMLERNFREFSRIVQPGDGALAVVSCDTHPAGQKQLIAAGEDKTMTLLNYETGHVLRQWKKAHERDINCLTNPHRTSGVFCSGSRDKTIRLWKMDEPEPVHVLKGHELNVTGICHNPEGTLLASGSRDNSVRLWDMETGNLLCTQDVKLNIVHFVKWIAPMNCVVQGGEDLTVRLWDVRTEGHKSSIELAHTLGNFDYHPICADGYFDSPDRCHTLFTGHNGFNNQGSMVTEWDLRTQRQVRQFDGHSFTVRSLRILRSDKLKACGLQGQLMTAAEDGTVRFWPLEESEAAVVENTDAAAKVHTTNCKKFELQEGKVSCIDETVDGLVLLSLKNGALVVLKPGAGSPGPSDPKPVQRYRYVGNPAVE